jgi:hypothetical protein
MSLIELTPEEKLLVEQHRNGYRGIFWHVNDFESQAQIDEKFAKENGEELEFDRDKFQTALEKMINEHDATLGITWDTVSMYLNDYCKFE